MKPPRVLRILMLVVVLHAPAQAMAATRDADNADGPTVGNSGEESGRFSTELPQFTVSADNFSVDNTYFDISGTAELRTVLSPMWYEIRSGAPTGELLDFGAFVPRGDWKFTGRHFRFGTNVVLVFARNSHNVIVSKSLTLTWTPSAKPDIRPRPHPAEIWWGGAIWGGDAYHDIIDATYSWDYVKRYEDGFFHIPRACSLRDAQFRTLAAQLEPYHTKYSVELDGICPPTYGWIDPHAYKQIARLEADGLPLSDATHDYHADDLLKIREAFRSWPPHEEIAYFTGDLSVAGPTFPYRSGQWRNVFANDYKSFPYLKLGLTSSPVWWRWDNFPARAGYSDIAPINYRDVLQSHLNAARAIGHPYFYLGTDCPWDYARGDTNLRGKIIAVEKFLHGQACMHTLICNVSDADKYKDPDQSDAYYKNSSLNKMYTHQIDGGRANRYLFEAWYPDIPHSVVPEDKPNSYTNLALDAIKYMKGISDVNGSLERLTLAVGRSVAKPGYDVQIKNYGDIACLPALTASEAGGTKDLTIHYSDSEGKDVTAAILSAEGYVGKKLLSPGQATTIHVSTNGSGAAKAITFEAFWNPQDPTGVVRDRKQLVVQALFPAP